MSTLVTSTMFVAKQRPVGTTAADGTFQLTLRLLDRVGSESRQVESWLVRWSGREAAAWWHRHAAQVVAGQPVDVVLCRPRVFYTGRGDFRAAELHATARRLALAPRRRALAAPPPLPPCPAGLASAADAAVAAAPVAACAPPSQPLAALIAA